jgi:hypothetical protein
MVERRKQHRRHYKLATRFPLHTLSGQLVTAERRRLPTRRLNDIQVEELNWKDFVEKLQ